MNKKGEIEWVAIIAVTLFVIIIGLIIWGAITSVQNTQEKHDMLCERNGMDYFSYRGGAIGHKGTVVCLTDDGEQVEVLLK